jgi:hypothetical protein
LNVDEAKSLLSRLGTLGKRLFAICLCLFGLAMPFMALVWGPPRLGDLVQVEGPLISYSLYKRSDRHTSDVIALMTLGGHQGRYWNDSLKNGLIKRLDGRTGSTIRTTYAPNNRIVPTDGDGVKTWGLWIDGVEIRSPDDDLEGDQILAYGVLPVLGLGIASVGFFGMKRLRRQREAAVPGYSGKTW